MKLYKVRDTWNPDVFCKVQIDHDHPKFELALAEMVEFWSGWEDVLVDNHGDYLRAFLKMLGAHVAYLAMEWNIHGVKAQLIEQEGWYPLDGSYGIELIDCGSVQFEPDYFEIEEL
jgi:hypothetical protein